MKIDKINAIYIIVSYDVMISIIIKQRVDLV